jgi:hypothetical protein
MPVADLSGIRARLLGRDADRDDHKAPVDRMGCVGAVHLPPVLAVRPRGGRRWAAAKPSNRAEHPWISVGFRAMTLKRQNFAIASFCAGIGHRDRRQCPNPLADPLCSEPGTLIDALGLLRVGQRRPRAAAAVAPPRRTHVSAAVTLARCGQAGAKSAAGVTPPRRPERALSARPRRRLLSWGSNGLGPSLGHLDPVAATAPASRGRQRQGARTRAVRAQPGAQQGGPGNRVSQLCAAMSPGTTIPRRPDEERAAQLLIDDRAAGPGSCAALWSNRVCPTGERHRRR